MRKAYFFGFGPWRHLVPRWFADRRTRVVSRHPAAIMAGLWPVRLLLAGDCEVYVWGFKYPPFLRHVCRLARIPFFHVEDGFIRSISLGADRACPASLTIDGRTMHYDASRSSDLEVLLQTYDFQRDTGLMVRARRCLSLLIESRLSKYNAGERIDIEALYGPKRGTRILVIGQVETDASIRYGCDRPFFNNDLVRLAATEHPDAQIIYKPHPDVLRAGRDSVSDPRDVAHLCQILTQDLAPADVLETIDRVYTITSLMGFEAVIRGIAVTCVGCPFYAGWGVTDDRQPNGRRTRVLSHVEIFAASYLIYSRYFDPETGSPSNLESVIDTLDRLRGKILPA